MKKTLRQKINSVLDIPPDLSKGACLVTLRSRSELSLGGACSILLYTPNEIKLALRSSALSVNGEELVCTTYHKDEVKIFGKIDSISFDDTEKTEK